MKEFQNFEGLVRNDKLNQLQSQYNIFEFFHVAPPAKSKKLLSICFLYI